MHKLFDKMYSIQLVLLLQVTLYIVGTNSLLNNLNQYILLENAERLGKNERQIISKNQVIKPLTAIPLEKAMTTRLNKQNEDDNDNKLLVKALLDRDGCVSISNILSKDKCNELSKYINENKIIIEDGIKLRNDIEYDDYFGAVNNRKQRADFFLPYDIDIVKKSFLESVKNLQPLLNELVDDVNNKEQLILHELSSIISDPGSTDQCMHCDTPYLDNVPPLYTFFIALCDVEDNMGHTLYLPRTHRKDAHSIFNGGIKQKDQLLSISPAVTSNLKQGDVVIFDSRILHSGGANTSMNRRTLFYFTFTTGDTTLNNPNPKRGSGSIRRNDYLKHNYQTLCNDISE